MEEKRLICINCPLGCSMRVTQNDAGEITLVEGFACRRGEQYARREVTAPLRMVTSTVRVRGARHGEATVSCKTAREVPKDKIFDVMRSLKGVAVPAPVHIGDVIKADAGDTGVDVVATREVE